MSTASDNRREELLAAARRRLSEEGEPIADDWPTESAGPELRYRGQVVRQGNAGTPGSGIGRQRKATSQPNGDVRASLQKIKQLYQEGLISRADAERKRAEILDRL